MVELEMWAGTTNIVIPYKIDTRSEGNIMPLFIFKKLFKNFTDNQPERSIKGHITLRTYNKTKITQLGMCMMVNKFKNIKKRCVIFVVPGHGQVLLGKIDKAALKLINISIDSIQAKIAECKTNSGDARESDVTQEMHVAEKGCTNMDADSKIKHSVNGWNYNDNVNTITNYFLSSSNTEADKRKIIELKWKIHNAFGDVFNGIWCFEGTFLCSSSLIANHIKHHQGVWHMCYRNRLRRR